MTGFRWGLPMKVSPRPRAASRHGAGDPANPVGGWYGLWKGYRGRFGMYLPPLLEALGLAELTHEKRNNTVRALPKP